MTEPLGRVPMKRKLVLSPGADFQLAVRRHASDPEIEPGTVAEIKFYDATDAEVASWPATTITTDRFEWLVHTTDTDTIADGFTHRIYAHYPLGAETLDVLLVYGDVQQRPITL